MTIKPLAKPSLSFDIFCRVIDNFGDIGVCWRLAKQLADAPERHKVRLWVDDLQSFSKIEKAVNPLSDQQVIRDITLVHWTADAPALRPFEVVIEAFACDPPPEFIARMVQQQSLWINLEYLSAETWVEGCHTLPSIQANGLDKYFFFPGFTAATGGLLREPGLLSTRDEWIKRPSLRWELLQRIGMPSVLIERLQRGWRQVFLFCYPSAPAQGLLRALARQPEPTVVIVPAGVYPSLKSDETETVYVFEAPFVNQTIFDQLLWCSDLNLVRGEDSLVRALWAGKPLIWQIYEQKDDAHVAKLKAWLAQSPFSVAVQQLMLLWNTSQEVAFNIQLSSALAGENWATWKAEATVWTNKLAQQTDLATQLVLFCAKYRRTG